MSKVFKEVSSKICADFSSKTLIPEETELALQVQWQDMKKGDIIITLIKISVPLSAQAINTSLI